MTHVRRSESDGVLTITFTSDDKLNAVDLEMMRALRQAASDLAERTDLRVLVITAEGRYFTAGMDAARMERDIGVGADGVYRGSVMRRQYRESPRICSIHKGYLNLPITWNPFG